MPDRSSRRRKRPTDINALAASIVGDATADEPEAPADDGKDPAAKALGAKGGKARAAKLSKKRRSEIAKKAAETRWKR